jgi:hypothetical protein
VPWKASSPAGVGVREEEEEVGIKERRKILRMHHRRGGGTKIRQRMGALHSGRWFFISIRGGCIVRLRAKL